MTRRALLSMLALAVADPERLIWRPGTNLISIPAPKPVPVYFRLDPGRFGEDISAIAILARSGHVLSVHRFPPGQRLNAHGYGRFTIGSVPPSPALPAEELRFWPGESRRRSSATGRT